MMLCDWIGFDNRPVLWWIMGHGLLGIFTVWLLLRHRPAPTWVFLAAMLFISAFMRLPLFLYSLSVNPDESQMLAQGITLTIDPLMYRSVDPTTGGPVNSYLLALLGHLGAPLNFQLLHILSWLLGLLSVLGYYKTLQLLLRSEALSQLAVIPALAFISLVQESNYVHYYSEIIAILLLTLNGYLLAHWIRHRAFHWPAVVIFGASSALIALCKIQALPLAFVLGVWGLFILYSFQKPKFMLLMALSTLLVWSSWLFYMWHNGLLNDFLFYYIKANAELQMHFSARSYRSPLYLLVRFPIILVVLGRDIKYFLLPFFILAAVFLFQNFSKKTWLQTARTNFYFWAMLAAYAATVVAVLIRTGSFFAHHFNYFLLPCCLFIGLFLTQLGRAWRWAILATQMAYFVIFFVKLTATQSAINLYSTGISKKNQLSAVGKSILKYGKPGQYLVVWGWNCDYYVETQMPQGVNENHSVRSAMKHPLQAAYLKRYLMDLKRTKPAVFADAVTSKTLWMYDAKKYGHQNYPALNQYIAQNYVFKEMVDSVRIYARKL